MSDFAKEVQELWKQAETADSDNRKEALDDLKFAAGEQWDPIVRAIREGTGEYDQPRRPFPLPCLTINTLPQFIGQVIGDRRANQTSIKVLPREDGDKTVAETRTELIRGIELQSKADRVRSQAFEQQVTCGIGHTRVNLDYAHEDAFERDLFIRGIANPLAVLWDPLSADPTGRDAEWCFVSDRIMREEYKKKYPDAPELTLDAKGLEQTGWLESDTIRIAEYWKIEARKRKFALMGDGRVVDVTDEAESAYRDLLFRDQSGNPRIRESDCKYAVMVVTNGRDELSDPFELKLPRLPIIRWMGREVWVGDKRVRFGLTRFARDPQRLKNYWRSVVAEKLMLAPRHNFIASATAIKGRDRDWPNTLVYTDGAEAPKEVTQGNLAALLNEAEMCAQDMKDTTGIHDASLGIRSNETSGVAIQRRQHEGDIATIVYHDNANSAMQEEGEVINALIPIVYDTPRTIRTVGADEAVKLIRVNDPFAEESIDLSVGRYDVSISTGPAYMTRRQEAASSMIEFARAMGPEFGVRVADLVAEAQDWPKADVFAKRLRPDDVEEEDEELTPEQKRARQQQQQMLQAVGQAEARVKIAAAEEAEARARKAEADARKATKEAEDAEAGLNKQTVDAANAETSRIKAITAKDFPLPPEAVAILAPIVTQAVMQALASPDVLPPPLSPGEAEAISQRAYEDAAEARELQQMNSRMAPVEEGELQ